MTVQEAIDLTARIHNYSKSQVEELKRRLLIGDITVITRIEGAREYILNLPIDQIQKEIATFASIEETIEDILNNSNVSENIQKDYVAHQFLKFWQKDTPYVLSNGKIFTFKNLKNYMIKGILADSNNINNQNKYKSNDLSGNVKNEEDALKIVEWCQDEPNRLDKAINQNKSLSDVLLKHALDYYYFEKKNNKVLNNIVKIATSHNISPGELISNVLLDTPQSLIYNLSFEEINELNNLDKNQAKIELLVNSINLYRYSKEKSGSLEESIGYGGINYKNSQVVHENIIKNNLFINNLLNSDNKELKEFINNLSYSDLMFLSRLYMNCHENEKLEKALLNDDIVMHYPNALHLENTLKSKEFKDLLNKGKKY